MKLSLPEARVLWRLGFDGASLSYRSIPLVRIEQKRIPAVNGLAGEAALVGRLNLVSIIDEGGERHVPSDKEVPGVIIGEGLKSLIPVTSKSV